MEQARGFLVSRRSFVEKTSDGLARLISEFLVSEKFSHQAGWMQSLDPRVRVAGVFVLVVAAVVCRDVRVIASLFVISAVIAFASSLDLLSLAKRIWIVVLIFTGLIALPALFITPGKSLLIVPGLRAAVTAQGLHSAVMLIMRVETAATLTATLVLCTPWTHVLKALRSMMLPAEIVTMLTMTQRYIFLLAETARQMFESRESRTVGRLSGRESRKMVGRTAGVLFSKTLELSQEVYLSMLSRGFRGEVRLLNEFRLQARDYAALAIFVAMGLGAIWIGR
jgi:cobalt/nickel transport system permease protein